jgi:K+/H+ antiporter YhaU regulatory subunit KhtT
MNTAPDQLAFDIASAIDLVKERLINVKMPHDEANKICALLNLAKETAEALGDILDPSNPQYLVGQPLYSPKELVGAMPAADYSAFGTNITPIRRR